CCCGRKWGLCTREAIRAVCCSSHSHQEDRRRPDPTTRKSTSAVRASGRSLGSARSSTVIPVPPAHHSVLAGHSGAGAVPARLAPPAPSPHPEVAPPLAAAPPPPPPPLTT